MNKKIIIDKVINLKKKIIFTIIVDEKEYDLFYSFDTEKCVLDKGFAENIDAIVVTFLIFALKYGYNIESTYSISEKLYYQLMYHIIPQIRRCNPQDTFDINIVAPLSTKKYDGSWVGTGISCGVDSLTSIYEYTDLCNINNYKLTHLLYFKAGAHDGQLGYVDENVEENLYRNQLNNAKIFCSKYDFPLIVVESNLNIVLSKIFGFTNYDISHTYRNCGIMLLLQNYFSKYYYSDAYSLDAFNLDVNQDVAHYEKWLLPLLSNDSINFYSSNKSMTRFDKTKLLSNYSKSYDNLLVCWHSNDNCGTCDKCIRTMVTLDLIGKLELYRKSFNLDLYYKNKKKYLTYIYIRRKKDCFFKEIYNKFYEIYGYHYLPSLKYIFYYIVDKAYNKIKKYI